MEASEPDSPQAHKPDEVKVPLYQAAKGYSALVIYWMRLLFYSNIVGQGSEAISLIDPENNLLGYVPVDDKDKDLLTSTEGIEKTIDRFRDPDFRFRPVTARSKGKPYYLYLVYDDGKKIYMFRNINEFKQDYNGDFDIKKLRPLTYIEMLYTVTYYVSKGRYGLITRYPVTDQQSIFPAKTHLMSTSPARIVTLVANAASGEGEMLPEYPVIGSTVEDVLKFHPSRRAGLGADYDGDTVSWNPIYGEEANNTTFADMLGSQTTAWVVMAACALASIGLLYVLHKKCEPAEALWDKTDPDEPEVRVTPPEIPVTPSEIPLTPSEQPQNPS